MELNSERFSGIAVSLAIAACVMGLTGCQPKSAASGASPGSTQITGSGPQSRSDGTGPSESGSATSACTTSGMTIPAGRYSGAIKTTLTTQMHLNLPGVSVPSAGGDTESMSGTVTVISDGRTVTGSITMSGLGLSQVGLPGGPAVHSVDNGDLTGRISGSASDPIVNGTLSGEWASLDAPIANATGSASNSFQAGLHVSRVGCASISGDAIAMFAQIAAPVAQYLSIGGSGSWTANRG